jgi:hypothetical protein
VRLAGTAPAPEAPAGPQMPSMDECLAEINALPGVLSTLTADDLSVFGLWLVNDMPFKDGRRAIATDAVDSIARMMPGTPYMVNHAVYPGDPRVLPVGTAFRGLSSLDANGAKWAGPLLYVLNEQPFVNGRGLSAAISGGQVTEASIGMYCDSFACSICGEQAGDCEHVAGMDYGQDGGMCVYVYDGISEVEEFSAVMSGAISGTRYFKIAASEQHDGALDPDEVEARVLARAPRGLFARMAEQEKKREAERRQWIAGSLARIRGGFKQAS